MEESERQDSAQIIRIMLEAGADLSLECYQAGDNWVNAFVDAVESKSLVSARFHSELSCMLKLARSR